MHAQHEGTTCMHNVRAQHEGTSQTELEVRYRPNAASGGWSYGRDHVMMTYEGDTPGLKWLHHLIKYS